MTLESEVVEKQLQETFRLSPSCVNLQFFFRSLPSSLDFSENLSVEWKSFQYSKRGTVITNEKGFFWFSNLDIKSKNSA